MADKEQPPGVPAELAKTGAVAPYSGSWPPAERPLLDRDRERRAVDDVLDRVRQGFSGALVLRGDHGVGKTALLDYAIKAAVGFEISAVVGAEPEVHFAFGAVHQLLIPFMPLVDDLPVPQRQAVTIAFGMETGPPPHPFLVGLACLTLLSRAAEANPVLCAIDDANWIDAESALVLAFVARRLYADRVGMIIALKDDGTGTAFEKLPAVEVGGLPDGAATDLLQSVAPGRLDPELVGRVLDDTGRNALALVEIGSSFTAEELAERAYRPEPMPVGRQLRLRYLRRVSGLPADAKEFVLLVAADGSGDRGRARQAAADANVDADAAEAAAEAANLLEVSGNSIHFRHPLIRAAIYNGASDVVRRRAHRSLSEVYASGRDEDRRAWHLAAASAEPDERVAQDLERAAKRASDRGAWATAAGLLRRSIELTPDDADRARREVGRAEAELVIGQPGVAQQIADAAWPRLGDDGIRGRAQMLSGVSLYAQGHDSEAAGVLADASAVLGPVDPVTATDAFLSAMSAAICAGPAEREAIARAAAPPHGAGDSKPRVSDLLLAGYRARLTTGYGAAVASLRGALRELRADDLDPELGLRWFELGVIAAGSLWDDQALVDISDRWVRVVRRLGAFTYLPVALSFRAIADWLTGNLNQAADRWAEMREVMAASPGPGMIGIDSRSEALLYVYRGDLGAARAAAQAQIRESTGRGQGAAADMGRAIGVIADLCAGDGEAAVDAALQIIERDPPFTAEQTLPDLVQAAVSCGNQQAAATAFATLDNRTSASGTAWALGLRARCLALISNGERAEQAYREAISQLERSRVAVDVSRAHLLYGQWLRRANRRRDARSELRIAEAMYDAMGADGFAAFARDELRATGERARSRSAETDFLLTPQEARVAHLAAEGSTNSEIAEQLFISPSTVEYHLAKVFRKLGIRSRSQLVHKLPGRD